jgi:hypothetical protein
MKEVLRSHLSLPGRVGTRLSIAGMRLNYYFPLLLTLAAFAALSAPGWYSSPSGAQSGRARLQQDIEQVFLNHEEVQLDTRATARRVQESGRLSLVTPRQNFEIQLRPHDVRAQNYRAEEVIDGGIKREVSMPLIRTYRGNVAGMPGAEARFTVDENRLEGMIITSKGSYFLEAARNYSSAAGSTDYLLYEASDVRPDVTRVCGTLEDQISRSVKDIAPKLAAGTIAPDAFSPFKVVEIATEADGEFTAALGGSAAANGEILSIMNQVQAIYQRDIGLTFNVVFQHTWTDASSDPYTASGAVAVINEFTSVWNRDFAGTPRDLAHLWTGRDLGGPSGIAWMGVVCRDGAHSYGVSNRETMAPFRVGIPAHEIGHNFNATHADGQAACDNTIMAATQNQSNSLTLCPFSVNEITAYVNGNSSCLTNAPAGNPIDQADFFVRQHYLDFLNRQADQAGLAFWTNQITSCGGNPQCIDSNRVNVSGAFFLSIEFQQTGYLVERLYKTAYGDASGTSTFGGTHQLPVPIVRLNEFVPDMTTIGQGVVVGQAGWEQLLENNKQAFVAQFIARSRFTNAYPTAMTPAVFVQTLNNNAGNPLSAGELATLIAQHSAGARSRAQVLRQIAEHQNLVSAEFTRAFVLMQYFGYLQRNPNSTPDADYTGYDFWLTKLNQFGGNFTNAEMVKAFLTSIEYRQRFGTP